MKKILIAAAVLIATQAFAAKYITKDGHVSFYSKTKLENIEAENKTVISALETTTGKLQFSLTMKNFKFEKALMEEHFNENYVESDKFPKASFSGTIDNNKDVNYEKDGTYKVTVSGNLTIHGVAKAISVPGTITVAGGKVNAKSTFKILLSDYGVKIEKGYVNNISNELEIKVDMNYNKG